MLSEDEMLNKYQEFLTKDGIKSEEERIDPDDELDWHSMAIGFFLALGVEDYEQVYQLADIATRMQ